MADKKVDRNVRSSGGPVAPTESMEVAQSRRGPANMADTAHDKGKSALLDKFRAREERFRREQSLEGRGETTANASEAAEEPGEESPAKESSAKEGPPPAEQSADAVPAEEATP